jgi:site-specific DNA-methyltransferase (adenine-specific)
MLITNEDNMKLMARYEDNYFDLAIVDPPYGIGNKFKGGKTGKMNFNEIVDKGWDIKPPTKEYFDELFRVSKNQIIWGGNYFNLPPTQGFFIWDKKRPHDFSLAMIEYAWSSIQKPAKMWTLSVLKERGKIHPTQKPVELYEWLLINNAKEGDKILDTHLGSGSIALACHNLGYDLTACELDKDYYDAAIKRIDQHKAQIRMF